MSPVGKRFVGQGGANDGGEDLVQVGEALDGIGEGLFVDGGIFGPNAVADRAVRYGGKFKGHDQLHYSFKNNISDDKRQLTMCQDIWN